MGVAQNFYNKFHLTTRPQKKIITPYNFTYYEIIKVLRKYKKILDSGSNREFTVLDYGSGAGTLDFFMAEYFHMSVMGLDISPLAIKQADLSRKNMHIADHVTFRTLKNGLSLINNKKFDIVLCLEVIEHIREDRKLIKNLVKHLKPGGYLFLSTPTINAPLYKLGLADRFDKKVGHLRRYEPNHLKIYIDSIRNIEIVEVKRIEGILRNTFFIFEPLGYLIKFIRGPITILVTVIDRILIRFFGESNIIIIARKK